MTSPRGDEAGIRPVPGGDAVLVDGSTIQVRALVRADRAGVVAFVNELTPASRRRRFFSSFVKVEGRLLEGLVEADQIDALAVVAERSGEIVGIGQAHRMRAANDSATRSKSSEVSAEVAFVVLDALQGLGIATLLLESLAARARRVGITRFIATTAAENSAMRGVFQAAGYATEIERDPGDVSLVTISFSTVDDPDAALARYHRERIATVASLHALLQPRSIAVIGASRDKNTVGGRVLLELVVNGFTGSIVPVNPHAESLEGIAVARSIGEVSGPIDLAIIAIPAAQVVDVVKECAQAHVRSLLVLSSGFAEIGPEGRERQRMLLAATRSGGMRLVGPNCLGIVTSDPLISMHAVFTSIPVAVGSVSLMSQSGAVAIAIASLARDMGIGMSSLVSVGNKADVSGNDLLEYWDEDPNTKVIALYLESFGNPRKFGRIARAVSRNKPIVAIKAARSVAGSKAAVSHTGALAANDSTVDALFDQAGVLRVDEPTELLSLASALVQSPLPAGRRVAVVGNAGGLAILAADALSHERLVVATLEEATIAAIRREAPTNAALSNPIDLTALASPAQLKQALEAVLADVGVDAVVVVLVSMDLQAGDAYRSVLNSLVVGAGKPMIAVFAPTTRSGVLVGECSSVGGAVPIAVSTREAALVIRRMAERSEWLANIEEPDLPIRNEELTRIRKVVGPIAEQQREATMLDAVTASEILAMAGITGKPPVFVANEDAAIEAARSIGFPVCLKIANPNVAHRSDVGGVHLNLKDDFSVAAAFRSLELGIRSDKPGALVQAMSQPGIEMIVGVQNNSQFGPTVLVGSGGRTAELWRDTAIHLAPLGRSAARTMIESLRCYPLLDGFRGAPRLDREALVETIVRLAQLGATVPELSDVTINPVIVHSQGISAVDIKVQVAPDASDGRNELRLLRQG